MKTITEATYSFKTGATLTARYHDGRTRRAVPVLVTREDTGALYTVLVPTDGGTCTCTCPQFQNRCKGIAGATCKHISYALGHLLAEAAPAPQTLSPSIAAALGTTAEDALKIEAETRRQERLEAAEAQTLKDRELWD